MKPNIELEYRVRLADGQFDTVLQKFQKEWQVTSHVARLSFMCFFKQEDKQLDLRIRITNGEAEVVLKVGGLYASDRLELSQAIAKDQLLGFIRMFAHLPASGYIAERETYNFMAPEGVTASLIKAGPIAYIEFELMSTQEDYAKNEETVLSLVRTLDFTVLNEQDFNKLNAELDTVDWQFNGSDEQMSKLASLVSKY